MKSLSAGMLILSACLIATGCSKTDQPTEAPTLVFPDEIAYAAMPASAFSRHKPMLLKAEYMTCNKTRDEGKTILYNDKKTRPDAEFVSRDPRRGSGRVITYAIGNDCTRDFGVSRTAVHRAIDRAMQTWSKSACTRLVFQKIQQEGKLGYVSSLLGFGGYDGNKADIQHAGFLPGEFFNSLTPDGSTFVLAVTFTFIYFDENGLPTDIDRNGVNDVAFRETYYNDQFNWRNSPYTDFDIESVALHEAGHALGLSHFGKGVQGKNGKICFSPRAVMNAVYVGCMRQPQREDVRFECAIWKNWNR